MRNINKRDIKIFLMGMLVMFIIEVIFSWRNNVNAYKEGLNVSSNKNNEQTK
ncbi:hypothetical protein [Chryseotalea sanaruensis]|uniref:hypothetical protein n=1 Tax=Chryseotalea sanaruensis TaxID=2482724 RepID=UPI00135CE1B2|nr:hypothetical protein [Chryseotalea sanaruensis]